ncbi:hypothetical protein LUQ84_000902 [Hamiltosporidium tvaerminnensis]|nr:hypothetical protein LUQ84_000902 [Hamiltosporidium tvaerminnensis]
MHKKLYEAILKIKKLEKELADKELLIEILLAELKRERGSKYSNKSIEDDIPVKNSFFKDSIIEDESLKSNFDNNHQNIIKNYLQETETFKTNDDEIKNHNFEDNELFDLKDNNLPYKISVDDILEIFCEKKASPPQIKTNMSFEEFVYVCSNLQVSEPLEKYKEIFIPKQLIVFVENNLKGIIKYLFSNLEKLKPRDIYSVVTVLSTIKNDELKESILHDIIIFIKEPVLYLFYCYPFLLESNPNSIFIKTIKKILSFQVAVDIKIFKSYENILKILNKISENINLKLEIFSIESYCMELVKEVPIFENGNLNNEALLIGASIKLICNFMDWDWTYNQFIVEFLYPKFIKTNSPSIMYYICLITFNSYKDFGNHKSIKSIFDKIQEYISNENIELSLVAYLFIRQTDSNICKDWIETNQERLKKHISVDIDFINKTIVF